MRLLGKIAEAVVVKRCNEDCNQNRRWGLYARQGKRLHKSLDNFFAVGTGLLTTKNKYPQKYNFTDQHRDIIWLNKENPAEELCQITNSNNSAISAGIQLKVSQNGLQYLYRSEIETRKYEVPLVYFDLNNDFYTIANKIYADGLDVKIGVNFIRGKDIDIECHEMLLAFYPLVYELISGRMTIEKLIDNKLLFNTLKKEILEQNGNHIITINK
ncbi:hypothetical protein IG390_15205 [Clostridium phage CWou-2020b]|nr:hypothetical protein Z952_04775 [Clostridium botulinum C/D str. BKT75002]KEI11272.1 hypothetical protein Z954_08730 [Clostridium botulinum C/D str. BKT2873]QPW61919.1 hypothetical protein IG390_08580 [Clostridium botulinum]QPW62302.1 hypothetical protein IG390_15205 [Clostridium phage CWou-2020b]